MSVDYSAVCDVCRERVFAGRRYGKRITFDLGYGDTDMLYMVAAWMAKHEACETKPGDKRGGRFLVSSHVPEDYKLVTP